MAYDSDSVVTLGTMKKAMTKVKKEIAGEVLASGHLRQEAVDSVPEPADAVENVYYVVTNKDGFKDIYTLIDGKMEQIDDTNINTENFVTQQQLEDAMKNSGVAGEVATDEEVSEMLKEVFAGE
ncbi:hypothetical protein [Anaerotignum faecicola]|jgi:hypothetical protein